MTKNSPVLCCCLLLACQPAQGLMIGTPNFLKRTSFSGRAQQKVFRNQRLWAESPARSSSLSNSSSIISQNVNFTATTIHKAKEARDEANRLRQKACQLRAEASLAETVLRESSHKKQRDREEELDDIIQRLHLSNATVSKTEVQTTNKSLLACIQKYNLSKSKLVAVVERMHEREVLARERLTAATGGRRGDFTIGDMSNSIAENESELRLLSGSIDALIHNFKLLGEQNITGMMRIRDGEIMIAAALEARILELRKEDDEAFQRKIAMDLNTRMDGSFSKSLGESNTMNEFVRRTMMGSNNSVTMGNPAARNVTIKIDGTEITGPKLNVTRFVADILRLPLWTPNSMLPLLISCKDELNLDDLKRIKSEVLSGSGFSCNSWDSVRLIGIFRGRFLRSTTACEKKEGLTPIVSRAKALALRILQRNANTTDTSDKRPREASSVSRAVFQDVQARLRKAGLAERIQLFLVDDPEWRPGHDARQPEPRPVILALPKSVVPDQGTQWGNRRTALVVLSIASTIFTTFSYAVSCYALNPSFYSTIINNNDLSVLPLCFFVVFGVLALSGVHELAHIVASKISGVRIGLPIFLPSLQIGTFGSITPLRSFPDSRSSLLDLALSGPLATLLFSIFIVMAGVVLTVRTPTNILSTLATVPAAATKSSFLVGTIVSALAPKIMTLPLSQPIPIHPLFMIGLTGLLSSAINLLPIGRLDGGRACTAVFGRRSAYFISLASLLFLAIAALSGGTAISIFWGLLVTLFQRNAEIPIQDELTEVDNVRFGAYVMSVVLTVLVLAPFPGGPWVL